LFTRVSCRTICKDGLPAPYHAGFASLTEHHRIRNRDDEVVRVVLLPIYFKKIPVKT
jgi:hypothetical protein